MCTRSTCNPEVESWHWCICLWCSAKFAAFSTDIPDRMSCGWHSWNNFGRRAAKWWAVFSWSHWQRKNQRRRLKTAEFFVLIPSHANVKWNESFSVKPSQLNIKKKNILCSFNSNFETFCNENFQLRLISCEHVTVSWLNHLKQQHTVSAARKMSGNRTSKDQG